MGTSSLPPDDQLQLCFRAAYGYWKSNPHSATDWHELIGAAWEGLEYARRVWDPTRTTKDFEAWAVSVMWRRVVDYLRFNGRYTRRQAKYECWSYSLDAPMNAESDSGFLALMFSDEESPPEILMRDENAEQFWKKIRGLLPPKWGEVLRLYCVEGLLMREIADRMEVTESRISQIYKAALPRLRDSLGVV